MAQIMLHNADKDRMSETTGGGGGTENYMGYC